MSNSDQITLLCLPVSQQIEMEHSVLQFHFTVLFRQHFPVISLPNTERAVYRVHGSKNVNGVDLALCSYFTYIVFLALVPS